ncbi:MAG: hypothetical protein Q7T53_05575 [Deltaproteobacteria bacterium]|nr:hypothetical protein [Deltaproteobacteria bacterium]
MKHLKFSGIKTVIGEKESFYTVNNAEGPEKRGFYFLSNDIYSYRLKTKDADNGCVYIGIANPHYFHVLAEISSFHKVTRMISVDNNFAQLRHFDYIYKMICSSSNRIEYLQNLFKVRFNSKAIDLLENFKAHPLHYVHGGVKYDGYYDLEKKLWENLTFDHNLFVKAYGLDTTLIEAGLKINSSTIGDIDTYIATIVCCSRNSYEYWPFTSAFGTGFLRSEESFQRVQHILLSVPLYQILGDVANFYETLLISNRYSAITFYASNLLCEYFLKKHPALKKVIETSADLGTRKEPYFPEIDLIVIQDIRTAIPLFREISPQKNFKRELSIHTRSFSKVVTFLKGTKNIEVVNMPSWIKQDNGESKLPNTEYLLVEDFKKLDCTHRFSSILLHTLVGHGMPMNIFFDIAGKALLMTDNLIILEHNKESKDFKNNKVGLTVHDLRDSIGMESHLTFCPGKSCHDRNILAVYRKGT